MAINSRKISSFTSLSSLTGSEYLMVAYKNKSYKIPTELLISNIISSIDQKQNDGDGADNPITIKTNNGTQYTFHVYNGKQGSRGKKGETGDKGPIGDTPLPLYNTNVDTRVVEQLKLLNNYTDEQLIEMISSAGIGKELNTKLSALKEVYLDNQDQYDMLGNNVDDNTKYYIFED